MIDFNDIKTDGDSIKNANQIRAKLDILYNKLLNKEIENNNTVEIRNAIMIFDPFAPFVDLGVKKSNIDYIKQEYEWYKSMSLSINNYVDKVSIWRSCATKDKDAEVNSNYGYLVYHPGNGSQFKNCLNVLKEDASTRNAIIVYQRPSIYKEYKLFGMHDMICTMYSHFFIRNNKLEMTHSMRSNDAIFGLLNDLPWSCAVYQDMYNNLKETYPGLERGNITWFDDSLHVYPKHFDLLTKICSQK